MLKYSRALQKGASSELKCPDVRMHYAHTMHHQRTQRGSVMRTVIL